VPARNLKTNFYKVKEASKIHLKILYTGSAKIVFFESSENKTLKKVIGKRITAVFYFSALKNQQ